MMMYPDPEEFGYGAFLQQTPGADDSHFHPSPPMPQPLTTTHQLIQSTTPATVPVAERLSDTSAGKATPPSSDNNRGQSTDAITKSAARPSTRQQKLERKGHTKSRRGCYNCKRRRIKCQETQPACGHCVKGGLKCEYPAAPQITHQVRISQLGAI
jgi:Fungal Zn(2)-Cys(6) binuclear cluster domain